MWTQRLIGTLFVFSLIGACGQPDRAVVQLPSNTVFSNGDEAAPVSKLGLRSRMVSVNTAVLAPTLSPVDAPPASLELNLFDDATFTAVRNQWTSKPNGDWTWTGELLGETLSEVTLVHRNGFLSGNIRSESGDYQIRTPREGIIRIEEVALERLPSIDAEPVAMDIAGDSASDDGESTGHTALSDAGGTVDVLVVYTPSARKAAGSASAMESEIDLAIAETNNGYASSGVDHRLNLVKTVETTWDEDPTDFDFYDTLIMATDTDDGVMDRIHTIRDDVGADEVVVIVEGDDRYCGLAWLMTSPSKAFAPYAFAVVARGCATGNYTFAHEIGHNMGSNHDHDNADAGAAPYSYGIQVPDAGVRSIMAYSCPDSHCRRINRWSNPEQSYRGYTFGVAGDGEDAADNHRSLNDTAAIVASFRDAPEAPSEAPEILTPSSGSTLASTVTFELSDVGADQMALSLGRTPGSGDVFQSDVNGDNTVAVTGLPQDGKPLFARAWARFGDTWVYTDAVYATQNKPTVVTPEAPEMISPAAGSQLGASTVTFTWTDTDAERLAIRIGTRPEDASLGQFLVTGNTSFEARGLPTNGSAIWVSLYAQFDGEWVVSTYEYASYDLPMAFTPAVITSPADGSVIGTSASFRWTDDCNCTVVLRLKTDDGRIIFDTSGRSITGAQVDVSGLPIGTLHAELYSISSSNRFVRNTTYTVRND